MRARILKSGCGSWASREHFWSIAATIRATRNKAEFSVGILGAFLEHCHDHLRGHTRPGGHGRDDIAGKIFLVCAVRAHPCVIFTQAISWFKATNHQAKRPPRDRRPCDSVDARLPCAQAAHFPGQIRKQRIAVHTGRHLKTQITAGINIEGFANTLW